MDYLNAINVIYLGLIGIIFVNNGSNVQSRLFGLVTVFLAFANALKLDGLFS